MSGYGWPGRLLLLLSVLLSMSGCRREEPVYNERFLAFNTLVDLSIVGVHREAAQSAARLIEQDLGRLQADLHAWNPGALGRVNQLLPSGDWISVSPSILPALKLGRTFAEQSDQLLNPTIGKLVALWGFHTDTPKCQPPPDPAQIQTLLKANPRMQDLEMDGIRLRGHNPKVQLDFDGYAVGYGLDLAITHLREMGVQNAVINAGGNLRAIGDRDGQPWRFTIKRPSGTGVYAIVEVSGDESLFTVSDYDQNYTFEGKTYHNVIDPRTGAPATGSHAVTVLHQEAVVAHAAASALFVAGPERWVEIAKRMGVRYVILMDSQGTTHMTPAMAKRLELMKKDPTIKLSAPL